MDPSQSNGLGLASPDVRYQEISVVAFGHPEVTYMAAHLLASQFSCGQQNGGRFNVLSRNIFSQD
jgi:hypothetical protein